MNKKWIEISINILFWFVTTLLIVFSYSIINHGIYVINDEIVSNIEYSRRLKNFFLIGQPFFAGYFYLQYYFIQKLRNKPEISTLIIKSIVLGVFFLVSYNTVVILFFIEYIELIWFPSLWYGIFIFYATVAIGYGFVKVWFIIEKDKRQLEILNKESELNMLRTQLHPHFLFNTMNNLLSMVDQNNNPKLASSIDKLSNLLRYVVYENKSNTVPVADKINFIKSFAELHLLRFEDHEIDFKLNIIGKYNQQMIEKGILLCFIENAFKHGVQPEYYSFININIDITSATNIILKVKNSIPPKIGKIDEGGYGLKSTKERLELAYPNAHFLEITENETYTVTLKLNTYESNNS